MPLGRSLLLALPVVMAAQIVFAQAGPPPGLEGAPPAPPEGQQSAPPGGGPGGGSGPPPGAPQLPTNPDLPVFGAGGGRVLFGVAPELAVIRDLFPPLPADAPQPSAEPRNLEGPWAHDQAMIARIEWDVYGNEVPFTQLGRDIRDRRVKSTYVDQRPYSNASGECRPPGQPWLFGLYYPFQIYQTAEEVHFLFAYDHALWTIRLDQSQHGTAREWLGDSVGHWEGGTLVVETTNYRERFWIDVDGTPASKDARLTFRIRKIDYGTPKLEILTTVDDPKMYSAPWSFVRTFAWRPDKHVLEEYNCELQAADGGGSSFGLISEPEDE